MRSENAILLFFLIVIPLIASAQKQEILKSKIRITKGIWAGDWESRFLGIDTNAPQEAADDAANPDILPDMDRVSERAKVINNLARQNKIMMKLINNHNLRIEKPETDVLTNNNLEKTTVEKETKKIEMSEEDEFIVKEDTVAALQPDNEPLIKTRKIEQPDIDSFVPPVNIDKNSDEDKLKQRYKERLEKLKEKEKERSYKNRKIN